MTRIRAALARLRAAIVRPFEVALDWWRGIPDEGQVAFVALLLLGVGCGLVWPPAGLIAPGVAMTAISLHFSAADRFVAIALVLAVAAVTVTAIAVGGPS